MPLYEHIYLVRQDLSNQQVETMADQVRTAIEGLGGTVTKIEQWGLKALAYRVKKNRKAHFTLFNIDAPPAAIHEIERQHSINEDVVRYMTVRVEDLEDGPSARLQKRDRDDRRSERRRERDERRQRRGEDTEG